MYDVDELIDACKTTAKQNRENTFPYDVNHPLIGRSALASLSDPLKQVRYGRLKLLNRHQKIKSRNRLFVLCSSSVCHFKQFLREQIYFNIFQL